MPDEYEMCDSCLVREYQMTVTHDALDYLGTDDLVSADDAIRAIRNALGETYVRIP